MASYFDGTLGRQHADSSQEYYDHMEGIRMQFQDLYMGYQSQRELRLETTIIVLSFLQTMYMSVVYCAYVCRTHIHYEFVLSMYYFHISTLSSTHGRKLCIGRPRCLPKIRFRKALVPPNN